MLTPECRLLLLEQIQACRPARFAAGLPPDSPEEEEDEEQLPDGDMEDA